MTRIAALVIVALHTLATAVQPPTLTSLMTPTITPAVATPTPPPSRRLRHHDLRTRDPPRDRRARAPPLYTRHGGSRPHDHPPIANPTIRQNRRGPAVHPHQGEHPDSAGGPRHRGHPSTGERGSRFVGRC